MTKKKKIIISLSVVLAILVTIFGGFLGLHIARKNKMGTMDFYALNGSANKVVLFIGDGMGFNHIKVASTYHEKSMFMTTFAFQGQVSTFSNSIVSPTDSAASASALATGQKFDNKEVSRHNGIDIKTISEYAKQNGFGVGIVTTDNLYGATPACFSSHANKRGDTEQIILGQIDSNIDLFLGAGKSTYESYNESFESKGYNYQNDISFLSNENVKQFGVFENVVANDGNNTSPTLKMLTNYAVDYFEANYPNGYFLMIEGAHIDKKSHSNEIIEMTNYLNNFDESIKLCHEKLALQNNVAIIVTADHETGGLQYSGQSKSEIDNSLYTRTGHTGANVPYYIFYKTEKGVNLGSIIKPKIDNTDIFKLSESLFGL